MTIVQLFDLTECRPLLARLRTSVISYSVYYNPMPALCMHVVVLKKMTTAKVTTNNVIPITTNMINQFHFVVISDCGCQILCSWQYFYVIGSLLFMFFSLHGLYSSHSMEVNETMSISKS
eukprot:TRINITY_DN10594_c0_g1_i1.p3 TRINITY_DN10594_c0_g1~~TRINITY_DN10594_c0_g1_i1.p3  ORF type:complete len:120 (-),score=2.99 TRINITY_DN10594_c0_g1_i1:185-544(-)